MIFDYEILKLIWWALIGILLIGFSITNGMDIGTGILLPFIGKNDDQRRAAINVVGPHWDGNQVWLITAGGAIFAAWPAVYAAAFSGFYMAMLLVLYALFFRPLAFDYRSKIADKKWREFWDWGLFAGSAIPALIFGVAFGNLLQGVPFHLDEFLRVHYEGSLLTALLPLLNPFALLAGVVSLTMLAAHGAVWLQLRTEGDMTARCKKAAVIMGLIAAAGFVLAGLWVAFGLDGYRVITQHAPDATPNPLDKEVEVIKGALLDNYRAMPLTMIAPVLGVLGLLATTLFAAMGRPGFATVTSALGMGGVIATAGLSMFPFVMPSSSHPDMSFTVWDATSSHLTLTIMFWAVVIFLPIVLLYTLWCYVKMWGKVREADIQANTHSAY